MKKLTIHEFHLPWLRCLGLSGAACLPVGDRAFIAYFTHGEPSKAIRDHELTHVRQAEIKGVMRTWKKAIGDRNRLYGGFRPWSKVWRLGRLTDNEVEAYLVQFVWLEPQNVIAWLEEQDWADGWYSPECKAPGAHTHSAAGLPQGRM